MIEPRYPIYVPSKDRYEIRHRRWAHLPPAPAPTLKFLERDKVPHYIVAEPHQAEEYEKRYPAAEVLVLPWSDKGLVAARNWIKDHSLARGDKRHWQIDDNIRYLVRLNRQKRLPVRAGIALAACEDFCDRYENVAVAGLNYVNFCGVPQPPFVLNAHVYSCTLVLNELTQRWRLEQNDDVDMCLQVLTAGWCTVQLNAFLCQKVPTMKMPGGMGKLYDGDGRLRGARMLERAWPGVASVDRRFERPHFEIKKNWRPFDTPLRRRTDIDWDKIRTDDKYRMVLRTVEGRETTSKALRAMIEEDASDE